VRTNYRSTALRPAGALPESHAHAYRQDPANVETQLEPRSAGRCLSRGALGRPVCACAPARRGAYHPRSTRTSNHAVSGRSASSTCPCRLYRVRAGDRNGVPLRGHSPALRCRPEYRGHRCVKRLVPHELDASAVGCVHGCPQSPTRSCPLWSICRWWCSRGWREHGFIENDPSLWSQLSALAGA
jgi:hypothetical protein